MCFQNIRMTLVTAVVMYYVQGYLAHKKLLPHRTLQYAYA